MILQFFNTLVREVVVNKEKKIKSFDWFGKPSIHFILAVLTMVPNYRIKGRFIQPSFMFMPPSGNQMENDPHEDSMFSDENDRNLQTGEGDSQPNTIRSEI